MTFKKIFYCIVLVCFLFAAIGFGAGVAYIQLEKPVSMEGDSMLFTVKKGASILSISSSLEDAGVIRSAFLATLLTRVHKYTIKAGTYRISPALSTNDILMIFHEGKQEIVRITIPEGLTIKKTAREYDRAGIVPYDDFLSACRDPDLLARLGIPASSAEGFLFPDTYSFYYGVPAEDVVTEMVRNFFAKASALPNFPQDRDRLVEKVILASIIEREYRVAEEAPLIASVFSNRLKIGMGLQSCSTIEYIITEINGQPHPERLLKSDLEIQSDYNTYLWAGLPPGPISNPGTTALAAALNPPRSPYLYFRLTDPVRGTHSFTRSLDEHVDVGRQYYHLKAAGN